MKMKIWKKTLYLKQTNLRHFMKIIKENQLELELEL